MYKEFYNFSAEPFRVTPDPGFLYLTDQHKEALAAIIYGIAKRKGFICITGEVGVGKTTILRSYLDSADEPGLRFVYVFNPNVSFQALLRHILKELQVSYDGDEIAGMVEALRGELTDRHKRRETLVLLVDEAQNMPIGTLESLRMLSNLETATEKLVQIVLVGQPELDQILGERQLRQLESRIAVRTRLGPLSKADSAAYVRHRLKCVALDDKPAFSEAAVKELVKRGGGIPRRINVLADNALMTGFGHKARPVTVRIVRDVARELRIKDAAIMPRRPVPRPLLWGGAAVAASALVVGLGVGLRDHGEVVAPPLPTAVIAPTAEAEAVPSPQVATAPLPPPVAKPLPKAAPMTEAAAPPPPPPAPPEPKATPRIAPTPVAAVPVPLPAEKKRVLRIVAPGDTLEHLASEVYGKVNGKALDWVKANNPEITNVDRIQVGQIIEFPAPPGNGFD